MTIPSINSGSPSMTTLTASLDRLNAQETALQASTSSGVTADSYAGLGSTRYQALSLQPEITSIAAWQQNVSVAQTSLSVTQTALARIATIATNLQTSLTSLQTDHSTTSVGVAVTQAKQALSELASLANTQNGDSYVFAGTQQGVAPVTDPSNILTSSLVTSISASVAQVGTVGASAVETASLSAASDNTAGQSIFAASLSVDPTTAASQVKSTMVGSGDTIATGYVLTQGTAASATSTGSPIRDLIRSLATVASLSSADASSTGFTSLVTDTARDVASTSTMLTQTQAQIGQTQDDLTSQSGSLSTLSDALNNQLTALKGSDPATLATQVSDIKAQLSASYSLIADMKGMTLASYL